MAVSRLQIGERVYINEEVTGADAPVTSGYNLDQQGKGPLCCLPVDEVVQRASHGGLTAERNNHIEHEPVIRLGIQVDGS
jgi:hypothetical protein